MTLVSGDGVIGKSILLLHLSVATVLGRDWLGTLPEPGPVIYLSCEDDEDEICRRIEDIATHYHVTRDELATLHVVTLVGKDAALAEADRSGRMRATLLFEQLLKDALAIKPRLVIVDTVADVFAGKRKRPRANAPIYQFDAEARDR